MIQNASLHSSMMSHRFTRALEAVKAARKIFETLSKGFRLRLLRVFGQQFFDRTKVLIVQCENHEDAEEGV